MVTGTVFQFFFQVHTFTPMCDLIDTAHICKSHNSVAEFRDFEGWEGRVVWSEMR